MENVADAHRISYSVLIIYSLNHIKIHKNKVADTSGHNEQMKYFMGTEILVFSVENRELQSVDNTADSIDDTSCKEPQKRSMRKNIPKSAEDTEANPTHGNINQRRKPFGTGDPQEFQQDAE